MLLLDCLSCKRHFLSESSFNLTELVEKQKDIMALLTANNISLDMLSMVSTVSIDNAVNVISSLFSGNITALNETYVNKYCVIKKNLFLFFVKRQLVLILKNKNK